MLGAKKAVKSPMINALWNEQKLKALQSSYKRHTIMRNIRPKDKTLSMQGTSSQISNRDRIKQGAADYFQVYCGQVIPQIEHSIEQRLLFDFTGKLDNELERQEIMMAYQQRRANLAKLQDQEAYEPIDKHEKQVTIPAEEMQNVVQNIDGNGLSHHTYEDIGRFTIFPERHWKRMFPGASFGQIEKDTYERNKTWGVMHREEAMRITNELSKLTLPHERSIDYAQVAKTFTNKQVKEELLQNDQAFTAMQQDFSIELIDYLAHVKVKEGQEKYNIMKDFLSPPGIFDGLIAVVLQEMRRKPIRMHLCDAESGRKALLHQLITKIYDFMVVEKKFKLKNFSDVCQYMPKINLSLKKSDLSEGLAECQKQEEIKYSLYMKGYHKFCYHHWRPEDNRMVSLHERFKGNNTGMLLWGEHGCGKSQVLSYVVAWAHENNWINVTVPSCEALISGDTEAPVLRYKNGLYLYEDIAKKYLEDFNHSNEQLLKGFEVNQSIYGQYDISGVKDGDPEPCPRVWDELRQTWTDDWKDKLFDAEISYYQSIYERMKYRVKDKLPEPKTLDEIVKYGIENPEAATNCLAEILEQLYATDKYHTLITADGYNQWLQPTKWPSFRYQNDKYLKGHVPPHDIALVRLLMRFDGNFMRNGVKIFATSLHRNFNQPCEPMKHLDWYEGYHARVANMQLNDFRNAMNYLTFTGWMTDCFTDPQWRLENLFMETQGNWAAFRQFYTRSAHIHY